MLCIGRARGKVGGDWRGSENAQRSLRRTEQTDNYGIDNFGLLVFVAGIDHVMVDLHRFWKVHRGELEQPLGTPKTDQLPGQKVTNGLITLRGYQHYLLHS